MRISGHRIYFLPHHIPHDTCQVVTGGIGRSRSKYDSYYSVFRVVTENVFERTHNNESSVLTDGFTVTN